MGGGSFDGEGHRVTLSEFLPQSSKRRRHTMATTDHADLTSVAASLLTDDTRSLFRDLLQRALQTLTEEELSATIGAQLHERSDTRTPTATATALGCCPPRQG